MNGPLLNPGDVAFLLGVTSKRVIQLAEKHQLACVELPGGDVRFDPKDIDQWLEEHKRPQRPAGQAMAPSGSPA